MKLDILQRNCILIVLVLLTSLPAYGKNNDVWTLFWNKDETLFGYKDKNGAVKIKPKFSPFSTAYKFENIIAVAEEVNGKWQSYYLTKAGKIVGRESMHVFDNGYDCESEGFIRFRDRETGLAGMFDKNGEVAIPAEYSDLARVRNGMIMALKGARREHERDEYHVWVGGKEMLIDTSNHVLIDDFPYTDHLNFFSVEKTKTPHADKSRENFLAKDGSYYSFINFEKEFRRWLTENLLVGLNAEKLIDASFDTISWWSSTAGWTKTDRRHFILAHFEALKKGLLGILSPDCDYFISADNDLSLFIDKGKKFEKYFNNCGEAKEWIYPVMNIVVSHREKNKLTQDHYEFLRTDDGYKLISVTIGN